MATKVVKLKDGADDLIVDHDKCYWSYFGISNESSKEVQFYSSALIFIFVGISHLIVGARDSTSQITPISKTEGFDGVEVSANGSTIKIENRRSEFIRVFMVRATQ